MNIIPATAGDEIGIAQAHVNAWQTAYRGIVADNFLDELDVADRAKRWAAILQDPACTLLVAKDDDRLLGFVSFGKSREKGSGAADGEIWTMYVNPTHWRNGVGKALMGRALSALEKQGFANVWVWVLQDNLQAIAFYSSCGFVLEPDSRRLFNLGEQELGEVALLRPAS